MKWDIYTTLIGTFALKLLEKMKIHEQVINTYSRTSKDRLNVYRQPVPRDPSRITHSKVEVSHLPTMLIVLL